MVFHDVMALTERAIGADTAAGIAHGFAAGIERLGASYVQLRLYQRPGGRLTSATHWQAGGVLVRQAVPGWVGSGEFDFICFTKNPLLEPIRRGLTRYRFSDFAPHGDARYGDYWDALGRARIADAVCATAYGRNAMIASAHIGVATPDADPPLVEAMAFAASIVCEKLMTFAPAPARAAAPARSKLSDRERDVLAFVAEGKTDWEIANILGIAETTARFHVDNGRRKLGASNRSHAVARFIADFGPP